MPRPKGSPNKLTSIIKDKLGDILSEAIESLDIKEMSKAERLKHFSEHQRIGGLFYSVEYNADKKSGYHIHLMFNDLCHVSEIKECTREHLAWVLDVKKSHIQYYKSINSKSAVSGYVLKNMKADQIHYNFY